MNRAASIRRWRERIRSNRVADLSYRIVVGLVGLAVLIVGIILVPYPGPGWLVVFAGLGILASEFAWAHRILVFARDKYDRWLEWMKKQHWSVQLAFGIATCAIVIATLWLLGALGAVAGWVGFHQPWLSSPIF